MVLYVLEKRFMKFSYIDPGNEGVRDIAGQYAHHTVPGCVFPPQLPTPDPCAANGETRRTGV